jgi:hypothetical protein
MENKNMPYNFSFGLQVQNLDAEQITPDFFSVGDIIYDETDYYVIVDFLGDRAILEILDSEEKKNLALTQRLQYSRRKAYHPSLSEKIESLIREIKSHESNIFSASEYALSHSEAEEIAAMLLSSMSKMGELNGHFLQTSLMVIRGIEG